MTDTSGNGNGNSSVGRVIGPYRLVKLIGEGGMGEVYLAEQTEPIRRQVALKIIKLGMDTRDFVTRFQSELQAMAMMDHPYIAQVIDAGATDRGRPFFVMEYVQGVPLLQYCDENRLGITERLELFVKVCEGIQHAHQKAIIHRDLKSSNILVVEEDGVPWPKIIDFGVAKVIGEKITDQTIQTQMGQILGTPEFMSPEQADLTGGSIDTRTDVYLLGEVLYELLVGLTPFDREEMRKSGIDGMMYKIRMVDPPRPSVRLKEAGPEGSPLAEVRGLSTEKLANLLAGDLDWIVMMAMEKAPDLRYQTAHALIDDLAKHRESLPITARPPSTAYRWKKFVNRHRTGVIAAGFIFVAILLGITGTTIGMIRSQRAEKRANLEAATAKQVSDFMVTLFEVSDPGEARGSAITAREILDQGVRRITAELDGQPMTQARLMNTMGRVYRELGLFDDSRRLFASALQKMEEMDAGEDPQTAAILDDFAHLNREDGRYGTAGTYLEMALDIRERNFGPDHELVAQSLNSLGNLLYAKGEMAEALTAYEKALAIQEKNLGPDHPEVALILKNIGVIHNLAGRNQPAEEALVRSLAIREARLPANHPDISNSLTALAAFYQAGNYDQALEYYQRSLAIRETVYGPDHPQVAENLTGLAQVQGYLGNFESSDELFERALASYEASFGPDHPRVGSTLVSYGYHLLDSDRPDRARTALERGVAILTDPSSPPSWELVRGLENLGLLKMRTGDFQGALAHFQEVRRIEEEKFADGRGASLSTYNNLGLTLLQLDDWGGAREALETGVSQGEKTAGEIPPAWADCLITLSDIEIGEGNFDAAAVHLQKADSYMTATFGTNSREWATCTAQRALLEYYQSHFEQARALYGEAVEVQARHLPPDHQELVSNRYNLACLNAVLGDSDEALHHLAYAVDHGLYYPGILEDPDWTAFRGNDQFLELASRAAGGE